MAVDPADYPETTRGYPYPTLINAGGAAANAETDPPADLKRLAEAVDADVAAVEAAAGSATSGVASDLADHEADTTAVHGIADTSALVTTARQVIAGTGLTGGGTLAADRTLAVAYGSSAGTAAQGNDARLSDTRTPTDGTVTTAKIVDSAVTSAKIADGAIVDADVNAAAAIAKTKIAGTAITAADTGTVTDTMLAGSITPAKVTGTAVVQARTITAGTGLTGGGDLSANRTIAIAAGGVGTTELANDAVTTGKIATGAVGTTDLADLAVTGAKIANATITVDKLVAAAGYAPLGYDDSAVNVTMNPLIPVYEFTATATATLPSAASNPGTRFVVRNDGTGTVTVSRGAGTVNGLAFDPTIPGTGHLDLVSTGTTWLVLSGNYTTSTVGLATYDWNPTANSTTPSAWWRLIAYDSGLRDVSTDAVATMPAGWTLMSTHIRRRLETATAYWFFASTGVSTWDYSLPVGFRPVNECRIALTDGPGAPRGSVSVSPYAPWLRWQAAGAYTFAQEMVFTPAATLPTSLPGTQVTAPV